MTPPSRLLVIDDDPDIRELIKTIALDMGFECTATNDVSQFLDALAQDADMVMLDLMMPGIDGIEVLRKLAERRCRAKVILMSGIEMRVIELAKRMAQSLGLEVAGHLHKPFRVTALEQLLAGRPEHPQPQPAQRAALPSFTEMELRSALDRGEFSLYYQPQLSLTDRRVVGVEALARWLHPVHGMVPPDSFIPQIEKLQLMERFTWDIIDRGLSEAAAFRGVNGADPTLSLNLTAPVLRDLTLPDRVVSAAEHHGFPADKIILEITESGFIKELPRTLDVLTRLRMKQVQLSIDDFGTGYSMMQQLQLVPATELKIDRLFVKHMHANDSYRVLVRKIIEMGRDLGMRVVAEGVESPEQEEALLAFGCHVGQGFLFSRPLPPNELTAWLAAHRSDHPPDLLLKLPF